MILCSMKAIKRQYKRKYLDRRHNNNNKNRQVLEGTFRPRSEFDQLHTEDFVPKAHDRKTTRAAYEDGKSRLQKPTDLTSRATSASGDQYHEGGQIKTNQSSSSEERVVLASD
eukprot:Gb_29144 [translate_table: standard]